MTTWQTVADGTLKPGDRVTSQHIEGHYRSQRIVRIERPVPDTDSAPGYSNDYLAARHGWKSQPAPQPPTREQIAALERLRFDSSNGHEMRNVFVPVRLDDLDAVLDLFRKGAE